VPPSLPVNSVRELIAMAKAQPGKLNYASSGTGTSLHLAAELFRVTAGLDMQHIPYKGGAQAQTDVMSGQAQLMFNVLPSALPQIRAGKLRALAVTGKSRSSALPDVPTMIEAGVPGLHGHYLERHPRHGRYAEGHRRKLNEALVKAMNRPR